MGNVPISSQYIESVLIHMIWKDYCEESSADFIYNSHNVVNNLLDYQLSQCRQIISTSPRFCGRVRGLHCFDLLWGD